MPNEKCAFCGSTTKDEYNLGEILQAGKYTAHYFCVLLSTKISQSGRDNQGMLGFLEKDIYGELKRNEGTKCVYCKTGTATLMCSSKKCNAVYHLPCGLMNKCRFNFISFSTLCHAHRGISNVQKQMSNKQPCIVCMDDITGPEEFLSLNCCRKAIHKLCAQKLAANAGYFTKCPNCNDTKKFIEFIQKNGVFVPQRDASWEANHAYSDLEYQYNRCDAGDCYCPQGRCHHNGPKWKLLKCQYCGSSAIHLFCNKSNKVYVCDICDNDKGSVATEKVEIDAAPGPSQINTSEKHKLSDQGDKVENKRKKL